MIGALLRMPWERVVRRMLERLHEQGFDDLLLGYPTTDRTAIGELARLTAERPDSGPVLMVDSVDHVDLIQQAARLQGDGRVSGGTSEAPIRVAIELDVGYWTAGGRLKLCQVIASVQEVLDVVKLSQLIGIYATERDAVESFR